jgi:hypothetical protein
LVIKTSLSPVISVPGDMGKDSFQNTGKSLHAETSGHSRRLHHVAIGIMGAGIRSVKMIKPI